LRTAAPPPAFAEWLAHVRAQLDAWTRLDRWRGQPPHVAFWMLFVDRRFRRAAALALAALAATVVVAFVGEPLTNWLPWWLLPLAAAVAGVRALAIAVAESVDCRRQLARVQSAELAVASLVMANMGLFDAQVEADLPGVVVATLDPALQLQPLRLRQIAEQLYALKEQPATEVAPELRAIAATLASETGRFDPLLVPRSCCGNDATWISSCWFFRAELPGRVLDRRIFPVLALRRTATWPVQSLPLVQWWEPRFDAALSAEFGCTGGAA
jgi:hypothetical protein